MHSGLMKHLIAAAGWLAFGLGWAGIFLPGLPTTIFWILAALAFLRTNERMYRRIIGNRRYGPGIKLFIEEGRIAPRGKIISISAMMCCATVGAFAIPPVWVRVAVMAAATAGSIWVATLPTTAPSGPAPRRQPVPK